MIEDYDMSLEQRPFIYVVMKNTIENSVNVDI